MEIHINSFRGIKRSIKMTIAAIFFYLGIFFVIRAFNNLIGRRLTIVSYHRFSNKPVDEINKSLPYLFVSQTSFELQIKFFKKFYNIISFSDLKKIKKGEKLPYNSLIITIDDGYEDNYTIAYPILKKYNVPATIYLATDNINTNNVPWWDEFYYRLTILNSSKALCRNELPDDDLLNLMKRFKADPASLFSYLNDVSKPKISRFIKMLQKLTPAAHDLLSSNRFLSWEQVAGMNAFVDFGSHTCSHICLDTIDDQTIMSELTQSGDAIKKAIASQAISFAYPAGHYSKKAAALVEKAGYDYAVTLERGINDLKNMYALKRINIWEGAVKSLFCSFSRSLLAFTVAWIK